MFQCPAHKAYHKGKSFECSQAGGGKQYWPCPVRGVQRDSREYGPCPNRPASCFRYSDITDKVSAASSLPFPPLEFGVFSIIYVQYIQW